MQPLLQGKLEKKITYCRRVSAALGIQHTMRMHHIFIRGMAGSKNVFHITS
jgi:hypothetical protein